MAIAGNHGSVVQPDDSGYYFYFYVAFGQLTGAMTPESSAANYFYNTPVGFGGQWGYYTD